MKTAIDVIHRIQWDEKLDSSDFLVCYLDRFSGILEKPFDEFTWKDLAEVDYIDEFSVPQHRIHFFKWRNFIVWDKNNREDFVFGSANGNGKDIHDFIAEKEAK